MWWQRYTARTDLPMLAPPAARGAVTVIDLSAAATPEAYARGMRRWAEAVYAAWDVHHRWAMRELARITRRDRRHHARVPYAVQRTGAEVQR